MSWWKHLVIFAGFLQGLSPFKNVHWLDRISNEMWKKTGEEPMQEQLRRRKWKWLGHTLRRSDDSVAKQPLQWTPQGHRGRERPRNTWERFGEGNVDGRLQVQLEEDGGGDSRQSWMESSGLWPMIHWEWQGISKSSHAPSNFLQAVCPSWHPTNSIKTPKATYYKHKITTSTSTMLTTSHH